MQGGEVTSFGQRSGGLSMSVPDLQNGRLAHSRNHEKDHRPQKGDLHKFIQLSPHQNCSPRDPLWQQQNLSRSPLVNWRLT
jgi:hypothetical protein